MVATVFEGALGVDHLAEYGTDKRKAQDSKKKSML